MHQPAAQDAPHCVITGSASGIGRALAEHLVATGWRVTGLDSADHPEGLAGRIAAHRVDLGDSRALERLALPRGPVTAFVHCAGIMRGDADPETRASGGANLWQLHVAAPEALARRLRPLMPPGRGRMVLMSSRAAQGRAGRGFYAASKAALDGLVRSLAAEFVAEGITVNAVAPGTTDTPMLRAPGREGLPLMPLPIGRTIRPEEVAALIAFLIGDAAGAITGQTIYVCGGASIAGIGAPG